MVEKFYRLAIKLKLIQAHCSNFFMVFAGCGIVLVRIHESIVEIKSIGRKEIVNFAE